VRTKTIFLGDHFLIASLYSCGCLANVANAFFNKTHSLLFGPSFSLSAQKIDSLSASLIPDHSCLTILLLEPKILTPVFTVKGVISGLRDAFDLSSNFFNASIIKIIACF
jgi:hypothetical protein